MPRSRLDESIAQRVAGSGRAQKKSGDCGCGCDDCGNTKVRHSERVVVPGLANSTKDSLDVKALVHVLSLGEHTGLVPHGAYLLPVNGVKVGAIGSHSRVGQAAQAAVSIVLPGDMSDVRSPVRSTLWELATPGGGGGRRNRLASFGRSVVRRCPPGYEHGGRFANAAMSNCGSLLFDLATGPEGGDLVGSGGRRTVTGAAVGNATIRTPGAGRYGTSPIQRRDPNIPPVGRVDKGKTASSIEEAVAAASSAKPGFMRFIRKDGVMVKPLAPMPKLLRQKDNPEILGSTLVLSATKPTGIGGDEIKLLGNGLAAITYVVPGGHAFTLKPKKTLTARRAAALRRELESIRSGGDEYARALKALAEKHANELTFVAEYKNLDGANDMVTMERNGIRRVVQKWAFLTWYASNAPGRTRTAMPWRIIDEEAA